MRLSLSIKPGRWVGNLILVAALATAGCGNSEGTVSGSVTYKGQKLRGGTVTFINDKKESLGFSPIDDDGNYLVEKLPPGTYTVCVETDSLLPPDSMALKSRPPADAEGVQPPNMAEQAKRYVPIPPAYTDVEASPLKVEVKGGKQGYDIPLT